MRIAEQIRRTLARPRPLDVNPTIERLRREVYRLERRAGPRVVRAQENLARASRSAADPRLPVHGEMPRATDPQGQLFRHDLTPGFRFGAAMMKRPDGSLLSHLERALQMTTPFCPGRDGPLRAEDLLFLDLETTGLSRSAETIPFLIGTGWWPPPSEAEAGGFQVNQLFLRDPADEALALDRLRGLLERTRVLVTFNGRGFDLPLLRNRAMLTRTFLDLERPHLDLLPLCRRLFRARMTNCRLVTLERELLGFQREGDVEGSEVPRIYNEWLRTGQAGELPRVLEHNRLDVALMAPLLHRACQHLLDPLQWAEDAEELLGCALTHLGLGPRGQAELAETCLVRGLELGRRGATRRSLLVTLARHLRRSGRPHEASVRWDQLRREFPDNSMGWVELAKYHEHVTRDVNRALDLVQRCPHQQTDELQLRLQRLRRRVQQLGTTAGDAPNL